MVLAGLCSSAAFSGTQGDISASQWKPFHPNISLQLGGFWASQGRAQHINIDGLIGDDFSVDQRTDSNGLVGLGVYLNGQQFKYVNLSYGVNAFYLAKTSVSGIVTQEELFNNLAYNYSVTNWPIYFGAKADIKSYFEKVNVTLDAGIGPNIISTNNFSEQSLDGGVTLPDQIFSGHTTAAFSAMAGIGLKLNNVLGRFPLECGYRFFYLGQGNLSKVTNQVVNNLNTGNSYANAVLCSITV